MGCHADVGGGAVANGERHMLSRIPLRWMIRQCFDCETGILFNASVLAEMGLDLQSLWPKYHAAVRPDSNLCQAIVDKYKDGSLPSLNTRTKAFDIQGEEGQEVEVESLPEYVEDYFDALASINDQLVLNRLWWILEFWPVKIHVLRAGNEKEGEKERWEKILGMNLGKRRAVQDKAPCMHWTVKLRMEKGYEVRSRVSREVGWKIVA